MIYFEWIHRIISILTTLQQDHKSYSLLNSQKAHFVLVFISSFSPILYLFFYLLPCIYSTMYKLHCVVSTFYSPSTPFHWLISFILGPKLSLGKSWSWKPCCSLEGILSIFCSLGPTLGCRWFHLWSLWRQALRWILVYLLIFISNPFRFGTHPSGPSSIEVDGQIVPLKDYLNVLSLSPSQTH